MKGQPVKTITLYSVEFCLNGIGVFDRAWFSSKRACRTERRRLIDEEGCDPERELNGEYGCIGEVEEIRIKPTRKQLLNFARNYAVDQS